jgi:hypothetical protein
MEESERWVGPQIAETPDKISQMVWNKFYYDWFINISIIIYSMENVSDGYGLR